MSTISSEVMGQISCELERLRHPPNRPLIVAISGGVDSQVLTHALRSVTADSGPPLCAVHVDHGLREKSADDARKVKEICGKWGIHCVVTEVDVTAWDEALGQGTESAARAARYSALARAASDANTDTVVTGHTLDDQAETILLKLMAGSGLEGIAGMEWISRRPVQLEPNRARKRRIATFRPMLGLTRKQIEEYARENGITPVEDDSNQSLEYRRNAVRHKVLPAIEKVEPKIREALFRTSYLLRDDARFISDAVDEAFSEIVAERAGVWMLERQQFRLTHEAVQRRILYRVVNPLLHPRSRLSQERIEALRSAAVDGDPGKMIELAESLVCYVDYDRLAIGTRDTLESDLRALSWIPLLEPGTCIELSGHVDIPLDNGWRIRGEAPEGSGLMLRTRRDGDRTRGPKNRKVKLQDWLVDRKVPRYVRDWLPVVADENEIRWVIGLDITEFSDSRSEVHLHLELDTGGS